MNTPKSTSSGIQTFADGQAFIPSSKRADGSTRKEIKVRPGYRPPEDVEKYKSRTADTWRARGTGTPGADEDIDQKDDADVKSKNAKRREAARRKKESDAQESIEDTENFENGVAALSVQDANIQTTPGAGPSKGTEDAEQDAERQKKIRNHLKKLKAVRELKSKRVAGEKLSADQLVKISKEHEIIRDLVKLDYKGSEIENSIATQENEPPN